MTERIKTITQQQKDWEQKTNHGRIKPNMSEWDQASSKVLDTFIDGINENTARERQRHLSEFTTEALEQEILSRQKCQFGRLTCTTKAEDYIIKSQDPTCFNCQQDIVSLKK